MRDQPYLCSTQAYIRFIGSPEVPPKITIQSIIDTVVCSSCHHRQEANYGDSSALCTEVAIVSLATLQYGYMLDRRSDTSCVRA